MKEPDIYECGISYLLFAAVSIVLACEFIDLAYHLILAGL
jgi:hypothetical protein